MTRGAHAAVARQAMRGAGACAETPVKSLGASAEPRTSAGGTTRTSLPERAESGQASVELVAFLPLLAGLGLALLTLLGAGRAAEQASHAAEAGAVAILQDRDPAEAARAALPGKSRRAAEVRVRGRAVMVRVRPAGPIDELNRRLTAAARADAGPRPTAEP
jgi:hypothetical protein